MLGDESVEPLALLTTGLAKDHAMILRELAVFCEDICNGVQIVAKSRSLGLPNEAWRPPCQNLDETDACFIEPTEQHGHRRTGDSLAIFRSAQRVEHAARV
jgi:hypothetical protein